MAPITPVTLAESDVRAIAGERAFRRGLDYLGSVGDLTARGNRVVTLVQGSEAYRVVLTLGGPGGLRGQCDCPHGREGFFCKHCVAVGLTIARNEPLVPGQRAGARRRGKKRIIGVSEWLDSLGRHDLLLLVHEQMAEDVGWRLRLELRAAAASADLPAITDRMSGLLVWRGRTGPPHADLGPRQFASRVRDVADVVAGLIAGGRAAQAIEVAEQALGMIAVACQDAAGRRSAEDNCEVVASAAAELAGAHRAACEQAPADPIRLADFLADRTLSHAGVPDVGFEGYFGILGPGGLARLRERLADGREQRALERVLRAIGDVDALVAVIAADLDERGGDHLRIAAALESAGRAGEALAWAERGLREAIRAGRAGAELAGPALADFVAGRHESQGRTSDALMVRRDWFAAARDLESYRRLREAAETAGAWRETRSWALGLLRAAPGPSPARRPARPGDSLDPVLVDALIEDGDLAGAWREAGDLASDRQWLRLADLVAEERPAEAAEVYLRLVEPLKRQAGDVAYQRMVRLLTSARECHRRLGTEAEFGSYLRALRDDQKRKRKLLAILDAHGL